MSDSRNKGGKTSKSGKSAVKPSVSAHTQGRTPGSRAGASSDKPAHQRKNTGRPAVVSKNGAIKSKNIANKSNSKFDIFKLKLNWSLISKIAFGAAVIVLIIMLLAFQKIETQTALLVTMSNDISTVAYAIRDETLVTTTQIGTFVSAVENGSKVSKDEVIVNIFDSADCASAYQKIKEIDAALLDFENMKTAGEDNAAEISAIEKQMNTDLLSFSKYISNGEIGEACELSEELLYYFNKNQIATKIVESFDERVAELESEKLQLTGKYTSQPAQISSPLSGYFIDSVDGYEELLGTSILEGLTPELFDSLIKQRSEQVKAGVIGKIADDYTWYLVCNVKPEEAQLLSVGSSYTIYFPYSKVESIRAKLTAINPDSLGKNNLLIFECTSMNSELSSLRYQEITIELNKTTGLEVNKSSLTTRIYTSEVSTSDGRVANVSEEQIGVYIRWDNEIKFKRVEIIYEFGNMVLCTPNIKPGWLKLYDEVLIDTENMYDGKIINNGLK